ncbi:MAG: hypothetical protein LBI13_07615 [Streptococcaceae bacterium]|jgi:superfamily II DNA helicase RecQ|nr:hypothetical protein [Streptococcaceae bacterium]
MNLEQQLKENFGFDSFREGQKQIIEQVLENRFSSAFSFIFLYLHGL